MSTEPVARPHPEPVVLDIGGTLGALIVRADPELLDVPIEISPTGRDDARAHQHVLERPLPVGTAYAAVFDQVEEGHYTLWMHDQVQASEVTVHGGEVTELNWTKAGQRRLLRCDPPVAGRSAAAAGIGQARVREPFPR